MKAQFFRKVTDINIMFSKCSDDNCFESEFKITKIIEISGEEFMNFIHHFLCDYDFIKRNKEYCKVENNTIYCLKIISNDFPFGILVNSQGYDYARYVALVWRNNH